MHRKAFEDVTCKIPLEKNNVLWKWTWLDSKTVSVAPSYMMFSRASSIQITSEQITEKNQSNHVVSSWCKVHGKRPEWREANSTLRFAKNICWTLWVLKRDKQDLLRLPTQQKVMMIWKMEILYCLKGLSSRNYTTQLGSQPNL